MINLPLELVDLIFEFRDGNKKDNFDKVLTEFKSNVEYIREKMTTLYDDDDYPITLSIDDLVGDSNLLYFSFFKSYKMKHKENQQYVLYEFTALRDQLEDETNQYYYNKAMDALVSGNYGDHDKEYYEKLLTQKINFDTLEFGSSYLYWYKYGVSII